MYSFSATLNLIDLAGSERVKETNSAGARFAEAKKINGSLSELSIVISALANKVSPDNHNQWVFGQFQPLRAITATKIKEQEERFSENCPVSSAPSKSVNSAHLRSNIEFQVVSSSHSFLGFHF